MRIIAIGLVCAAACFGVVEKLYVDERTDHKEGKSFGNAGPYERITANATLSSGAGGLIEVIKPRDPAKGNGTLLFLVEASPNEQSLMDGGFTILRVKSNDAALVRDVVSFLRYGGPGFLLTDQRRFLKRFIAFASAKNANVLRQFVDGGMNKNEKAQPVFDVVWLHDTDMDLSPKEGVKLHKTKGSSLEVLLLELDSSLRGQ